MTNSGTEDRHRLAGDLLTLAGLDGPGEELRFIGPPTVLPSSFRVTEAASALVAAVSIAVARIAELRSGRPGSGPNPRSVIVDSVEACAAFQSERHFRLSEPPQLWDSLSGHYAARDGYIQFHTNFPHHRAGLLTAIGLGPGNESPVARSPVDRLPVDRSPVDRSAVEAAVAASGRLELERAVSNAGGIAAAMRTIDEWTEHPHAAHVAHRPPLTVSRRHSGVGQPLGPADPTRPLQDLRVLDLTRVIAGPVCARTLAAYGADVLRIGAAGLPVVDAILPDTTLGKRFAYCDITTTGGRDDLLRLVAEADVVVTGFRPGALAQRGLGTDDLLETNPNLVIAELSAFGPDGPWGRRRGFDSITQTATGIVAEETAAFGADQPRSLPCQLLDHGSGFLLALGVLGALIERHATGGSHQVEVSLLTTRNWFVSQGRADPELGGRLSEAEVAPYLESRPSPFGPLRHVRHPGSIDGIPARWERGPTKPGTDPAGWLRER